MNPGRIGLLFLAVTLAACATTAPSTQLSPKGGHPRGSLAAPGQWRGPLNPVTGNNATVVVWDGTGAAAGGQNPIDRVVVSCFFDQAVTVLYQVRHNGSATWRTMNGTGTGDSVSASTSTVIDYLLLGYDNRIEVVTGGTGPTTSEIDIELMYDRTLAL